MEQEISNQFQIKINKPQSEFDQTVFADNSEKTHGKLLFFVVILFIFILVGTIGYFIVKNKPKDSGATVNSKIIKNIPIISPAGIKNSTSSAWINPYWVGIKTSDFVLIYPPDWILTKRDFGYDFSSPDFSKENDVVIKGESIVIIKFPYLESSLDHFMSILNKGGDINPQSTTVAGQRAFMFGTDKKVTYVLEFEGYIRIIGIVADSKETFNKYKELNTKLLDSLRFSKK